MRFALVGNHPDGLEMAAALVESGRHQFLARTAPVGAFATRLGEGVAPVTDLEEVLANPAVEAVVLAGEDADRPEQLRRSLQSERHVLCVHPADQSPEKAYEADMIRRDTGAVLLPILTEGLHPAVRRLADFVQRPGGAKDAASPCGPFRLLEAEIASTEEVILGGAAPGRKPSLPGWDVLRALGGEVIEVSAFSGPEELVPGEPILLAGRFEAGGLFRLTLLPGQPRDNWRWTVTGGRGRAELYFPQAGNGPALLDWEDEGARHEEYWERWDPWPALVEQFEAALAREPTGLRWEDEIRCLELDDAARRSVERRRSSTLEFPEANEEVGFKGTMTLVGCAVLWGSLLLLILSRWVPWLGYLIVGLLVVFLGLQLLRIFVPPSRGRDE